MKLSRELVYQEYVINQKSDREIAEEYGVKKNNVMKLREYWGIETRPLTWEAGHAQVKSKLLLEGFNVRDLREKNKTSLFNFLVNRVVRVQVFTAKSYKGRFYFTFSPRDDGDVSENSGFFVEIERGVWKKDLSKTCDVIILCGFLEDGVRYYLLPSKAISIQRKTLSFNHKNEKYMKFADRWDLIHKIHERKTI